MGIATNSARNIVWLSSYPKSGNTWVRFLLLNLLYGKQESSGNLNKLIPDIHEGNIQLPQPGQPKVFVKSHLKMSDAMPFLERTAGFIYIVRHPVDVLLSNLRYFNWSSCISDDPIIGDKVRTSYILEYISNRGDPRWRNRGYGSWDEHVTSWLTNAHRFPGHMIRYEDLLADACKVVRDLCAFLELEKTAEEVRNAVDNSSFDRMKSIEESEIKNETDGFFFSSKRVRRAAAGNRFMCSGKSQAGLEALTQGQRDTILEMFHPIMQKFGYS